MIINIVTQNLISQLSASQAENQPFLISSRWIGATPPEMTVWHYYNREVDIMLASVNSDTVHCKRCDMMHFLILNWLKGVLPLGFHMVVAKVLFFSLMWHEEYSNKRVRRRGSERWVSGLWQSDTNTTGVDTWTGWETSLMDILNLNERKVKVCHRLDITVTKIMTWCIKLLTVAKFSDYHCLPSRSQRTTNKLI